MLTQALDHQQICRAKLHPGNANAQAILAEHMQRRAACFWATPCGRGCSIGANYQSTTVHLPPALATGKLDILAERDGARGHARQGRARRRGVRFIDKTTGKNGEAARASRRARGERMRDGADPAQLESARFPQGLANSSGKVGKYLMDTVGSERQGQIPLLENLPPHNEDGAGGMHLYAPWWLYEEQLAGKLGFARGYHIEFGGGRDDAGDAAPCRASTGSPAAATARSSRRMRAATTARSSSFAGRGEMIPNEDSYCEIDPRRRRTAGASRCCASTGNGRSTRRARRAHAADVRRRSSRRWAGDVRGEVTTDGAKAIAPGGSIIHEVGGAIMGADPRTPSTNSGARHGT